MRPLAMLVIVCTFGSFARGEDVVALSMTPYRVRLSIAFDHTAALPAPATAQLLAEVRDLGTRWLGDGWQIDVTEALGDVDPEATLERMTPADLRPLSEKHDRLYRLAVIADGCGFRVIGLEWEATLETLNRGEPSFVSDRRDLGRGLWQAVQTLFRPLAEIKVGKKGEQPTLEAKAAELGWPDPGFAPLKVTRQWEPFYRFLNKDQTVQKIQPVPWTFLQVTKSNDVRADLQVLSGLRTPLMARKRRIEAWALGVRTPAAATRLTVRTRSKVPRPLAGFEVRVVSDPKAKPVVLVTNRLGEVLVSKSANSQPVWLQVYSGEELLAKVPYVPGIRATELLDVPDDAVRLEIEGRIAVLQAELIDVVARRTSLVATTRSRAKAGDVEQVRSLLTQLGELKAPTEFGSELDSIRLSGTQRAKREKNRTAEFRIKQLCDGTQELITAYLNPEKLQELEEEMTEIARAAKDGRDALLEMNKPKVPAPAPAKPAATAPAPVVKAQEQPPPQPAPQPKPTPAAQKPPMGF